MAVGGDGGGEGQLLTELSRDTGGLDGLGRWPRGCLPWNPAVLFHARLAVALPGCCLQARNLGQAGAERQGRPVGPQRPRAGPDLMTSAAGEGPKAWEWGVLLSWGQGGLRVERCCG